MIFVFCIFLQKSNRFLLFRCLIKFCYLYMSSNILNKFINTFFTFILNMDDGFLIFFIIYFLIACIYFHCFFTMTMHFIHCAANIEFWIIQIVCYQLKATLFFNDFLSFNFILNVKIFTNLPSYSAIKIQSNFMTKKKKKILDQPIFSCSRFHCQIKYISSLVYRNDGKTSNWQAKVLYTYTFQYIDDFKFSRIYGLS